MRTIQNHQLKLRRIPDPEGDLHDWAHFAHTIKGYEAAGSFKACAERFHSNTANTLTELRCALFFQARSDRHGGAAFDCSPTVRELLRRIRQTVAAGELE
ncbi:MAG: hypothetical protein ACKO5F_02655 [Synechococcus sp.]